jgi:hypothetical protein
LFRGAKLGLRVVNLLLRLRGLTSVAGGTFPSGGRVLALLDRLL